MGYIVHYVVWNGVYVTLPDYTDFIRRARRKADEIQKKDHVFDDYLEECTQGCMLSPGHSLTPYNGEARFTICVVHRQYERCKP